jgi:hypothetical protein
MKPLLWTSKSLRKLATELKKKGHEVSPTVVGNLLHEMDYSLQANSKTIEDAKHVDRDSQFQYINDQAKTFLVKWSPSSGQESGSAKRDFSPIWIFPAP